MATSCVSCGAEVSQGSRFCQVCGSPLWTSCQNCGAEQDAAATFCSSCGAALRTSARRGRQVGDHEERRVVTVLFADLAGSTALAESIDPEDVRALQNELFELVNTEVERHGGVSEKFVGDAVLAVFGIPQLHEDDAERAVRAAVAIRDAFPAFAARVARDHGAEVGLRIGVNTGDVIAGREAAARGELMVSGDAVNVAARLQQLAEPGSVLVGERTRLATQRAIEYGGRAELAAKGISDSVASWKALGVADATTQRSAVPSARLVGRDDELALLRLAASRVERERVPQLVTVFGHAGVGKSRLVEEFTGALDGARVVVGRCVPYGDGITYLPLAEVASTLAGILDDDRAAVAIAKLRDAVEAAVAADHVEPVVDALAWTIGLALPERAAGITVEGDVRRRLEDAWARYLTALGRDSLLVLVVDDVHWASDALLDLLEHVVGELEDTAVLVLCPSRPELVDRRPTWGAGRLTFSSLALAPLGPDDATRLLERLLAIDSVPPLIARAILEPAEGNPFFVEEMLAMLVEHGALEQRNGGWVATERLSSVSVPDSIHGVIAARIDLLEAAERDALRRCSVMGRVFWPSAVGVDDDLIAGLGRRAIASEQLESSFSGRREFAFKHALTHDVAYATLPRSERRALHRRVAEWITEAVPDRRAETTELTAYHYDQAVRYGERDPALERQAFEALLAAAAACVPRAAFATADGLLERALELTPSDLDRARALLLAARVDIATSNYERALERLHEAIEIAADDPSLRADALGWHARGSWLSGNWRDAIESAEAAVATLEGIPESAELARALSRLSQIQMLRGLPSVDETATRAIAVARRTGERAAEANARINLFTARAPVTPPDVDEVAQVVELAVSAGAHDEAVRAIVNYLWSASAFDPLERIERFVEEAVEDLKLGLATEGYDEYLRLSLAALVYVPSGRWAEADRATTARTLASSASTRMVWLWVVGGLALRRGDLELADRHLPELRTTALASEEPQRILPMASVAMPRALLAGDGDTLRELADVVLALPAMSVTSTASAGIARSLARAGEPDRLARLLPVLEGFTGAVPDAVSALTRGLLALLDDRALDASPLVLHAEEEFRRLGRHYEAACVALDAARALDAAGDGEGADAARARAAVLLDPLGCVNPY